jgi:hypothetical protein
MTGWLENEALLLAGLDEADIATINTRLPDLQNLILVVQTHQAQINRVLNDLLPIAQKLIKTEIERK